MGARRWIALSAALVALALLAGRVVAPTAGMPVVAATAPPSIGETAPAAAELREPASGAPAPLEYAPIPPAGDEPAEPEVLDAVEGVRDSELPPDPLETGPATLTLRLVDARTGAALASRVELWRVDAPENESWSAGDQLQAIADVPSEGARLAGLPEGRYRADCACAAASRELPELELRAPHTAVELALELPREFELRVRFVDRFGEPYASAECSLRGMRSNFVPPPAVKSPRSPRRPDGARSGATSIGVGSRRPSRRSQGPQELAQTEDGLNLGRHVAMSRANRMRQVLHLRAPDGALAEVEVPAHGEGVVRMVAVGLPPDVAASRVRLPDGRPSAAVVDVLGLAQPCTDFEREWRAAPVRLETELAGFASVETLWRAADGELPWILLQPVH